MGFLQWACEGRNRKVLARGKKYLEPEAGLETEDRMRRAERKFGGAGRNRTDA